MAPSGSSVGVDKTVNYTGDPGDSCKPGQVGHSERECRNSTRMTSSCPPLIARIQRRYRPSSSAPFDPPGHYLHHDFSPQARQRSPAPRDIRGCPPPSPPACGEGEPSMPNRDRYPPPPPLPELRGRYPADPMYHSYGISSPLPPPPAPFGRNYPANERYAPYPPHFPRPRFPPSTEIRDYPPLPPPGRVRVFEGYRRGQPFMPREPLRAQEDYERIPPPAWDHKYRGRPSSPLVPRPLPYRPLCGGGVEPPASPLRDRSQSEISPPHACDQSYPSNSTQNKHVTTVPIVSPAYLDDTGAICMNMCRISTSSQLLRLSQDIIREVCGAQGPLTLDELSKTPFSYTGLAELVSPIKLDLPALTHPFDIAWCLIGIACLLHPRSLISLSPASLDPAAGMPLALQAREFIHAKYMIWELFGVSNGERDWRGAIAYAGPLQLITHDCKPNCQVRPVDRTPGFVVEALRDIQTGENITILLHGNPSALDCPCASCLMQGTTSKNRVSH